MDDNKIIEFPQITLLKSEIEKLKTELSMLILEKDELLYVECKNIEMQYMLTLGNLDYKAYELNCAILRLKRKIALIQTKINRQEKIVISDIEGVLDFEFVEYQKNLDEQIHKMNSALERSKNSVLSDNDVKELKSLYRAIVKALHPDLHKNISNEKIKLFYNAVAAYEAGDLNSLRIISLFVSEPVIINDADDTLSLLSKEKIRLIELIKTINAKIKEIKNSYPYNLKAIISDAEILQQKKTEIEDQIAALKIVLEGYITKIKKMLG